MSKQHLECNQNCYKRKMIGLGYVIVFYVVFSINFVYNLVLACVTWEPRKTNRPSESSRLVPSEEGVVG